MELSQHLGTKSYDEIKVWAKKNKLNYSDDGNLYVLNGTGKTDLTNSVLRHCHGIIMEKETNRIVAYSTPIPYRYPGSSHKFDEQLTDQTVYCNIRVWH